MKEKIEKLKEKIRLSSLNYEEIGKQFGHSKGWVSSALSGQYGETKQEEAYREISAFVDEYLGKKASPDPEERKTEIFLTEWQKSFWGLLSSYYDAHRAGAFEEKNVYSLSIACAESGIGKTYVTSLFQEKKPGVLYFKLDITDTDTSIVERLLEACSLRVSGGKGKKQRLLFQYLSSRKDIHMIVFDEVDLLIEKITGREKLLVFRELAEKTQIPVFLVALPRFQESMKVVNRNGSLAYLATRANTLELPPPKPSPEEIRKIGQALLQEEIPDFLLEKAKTPGLFRHIEQYRNNLKILGPKAASSLASMKKY